MKKHIVKIVVVFAAALVVSCSQTPSSGTEASNVVYRTSDSEIDKKVDSVLSLMTLDEKIGQMNQYNGFMDFTGPAPQGSDAERKLEHIRKGYVGSMLNVRGVEDVRAVQKIAVEESRLGIPLIIGFDVIHGYQTMSPIPLAESASWDMEAIQNAARLAAKEAAAAGINWTFAPMVDVSRDARWGRVMEGAGEDPFLGSHIAVARVNGFQGDDLSSPSTVAACAKHFAAYGFAEAGRDYNTADIGTVTLYNTVLPPFKAAQEAGARTFMNSFNELNGIPATADRFLQRDILKGEWGFDGFIVSDWGSITEMTAHGYAEDGKHAAELAANAGSDMDMESHLYVEELAGLVKEGKVDPAYIEDAARRILKVKFELGLFDDPYKYCDLEREKEVIGSKEMHEGALDMALKSIVLLKNENNLLPLDKSGMDIAVIGPLANDKNSPLGSWRIAAVDNSAVSVVEGLQEYKANKLTYAKGAELYSGETVFAKEVNINETDTSGFQEAVETARNKDVVIMVLGEHGYQSGEGRSRTSLDLPGVQQELLEAIYAVNQNIILVLQNGRPLALPWAEKNIPAIVEAWQLGSESGHAIAQVLYGDQNPSGKLPMSFPRNVGQEPLYYNAKNTGRPVLPGKDVVFWSHYQDVENSPLWPFGYGLSYSNFEYDNLQLEDHFEEQGHLTISFDITNTSDTDGYEVCQLYMHDKFASVTRPVRELKGFKKLLIKAGDTQRVEFELDQSHLGFYNAEGTYVLQDGAFDFYVGTDSYADLKTSYTLDRSL